jgi:hypothetical protein
MTYLRRDQYRLPLLRRRAARKVVLTPAAATSAAAASSGSLLRLAKDHTGGAFSGEQALKPRL